MKKIIILIISVFLLTACDLSNSMNQPKEIEEYYLTIKDIDLNINGEYESSPLSLSAGVFSEDTIYLIKDIPDLNPVMKNLVIGKYDIALKPGLILQMGKHFQIGFAFPIGLTNVRKQYPELNVFGSGYFRSAQIQIGWTF